MTELDLDRRRALGIGAVLAAGALAPAAARAAAPVDLNDPEQNLRAYIRMRGDLTGKTVVERIEARTFGVIERQLPRPLFAAVGIQVSRFLPTPEGFLFRYKYFSLTTDLATGAPMPSLLNPYTGKTNAIPPRITQPGELLLTTSGWQFTKRPNDPATQRNAGLVRPWARMGDQLQLTDTLISPPKFEVHPAFQLFTFMAPWKDAIDRARASVPASFAGTGMEDWRDWMEMGPTKLDGSLTVHMTGRKVAGRADFPDWLIAAADRAMPGLFETL